jgi:hypothetical protein
MAKTRQIKSRIRGVQNTAKIRAMEMIASSMPRRRNVGWQGDHILKNQASHRRSGCFETSGSGHLSWRAEVKILPLSTPDRSLSAAWMPI